MNQSEIIEKKENNRLREKEQPLKEILKANDDIKIKLKKFH